MEPPPPQTLWSSRPPLPRLILYKPFQFLKSLSLNSLGLGLTDIPLECGRELSFVVGTIACPIKMESPIAPTGSQEPILDTPEEPVKASMAETGVDTCFEGLMGDIFVDLRGFSTDIPEENKEQEHLPEVAPTGPAEKGKRVKMVARRARTPRSRPLPRPQPTRPFFVSSPSRPSRKSARIAFLSTPRTAKSSTPVIEEISSSSSEDLSETESENTPFKIGTPVFPDSAEKPASSQPPSEDLPKPSPPATPLKRKPKSVPSAPSSKKPKLSTPSRLPEKYEQLLKRHIVRGKIINTSLFKAQGLEVFLNKLQAQHWLDLFTNTQLGCSQPELVEFYANCSVTEGVVTSSIRGVSIKFDAPTLGRILEVPSHGFATYVREEKTALPANRLLEVCKRLSHNQGLQTPSPVKKGDMTSLHQLLFMFLIRNIIPRGQGRSSADPFDQVLVDLLDREEPINLPAIMIRHIRRITNTTRPHDLGYGFLLTRVFDHLGIELHKKVVAQPSDEIGLDTLMGCGFEIGEASGSKPGRKIPRPSISAKPPNVEAVLEENSRLKNELAEVRADLARHQAFSAKRFEELHTLFSALAPSIPPLQTQPPPDP